MSVASLLQRNTFKMNLPGDDVQKINEALTLRHRLSSKMVLLYSQVLNPIVTMAPWWCGQVSYFSALCIALELIYQGSQQLHKF